MINMKPHWVIVEREEGEDLYFGPYRTELVATFAMENDRIIRAQCEIDATECYIQPVEENT